MKNEKMLLTRRVRINNRDFLAENSNIYHVDFYRQTPSKVADAIYLQITETYPDWIKPLQREINNCENEIILYAQGDPTNGILGLYNCLKRETPNCRLRYKIAIKFPIEFKIIIFVTNFRCCFIVDDNAPPFSPTDPFYVSQLSKNLNVNVWRQNSWGCYVHYPLDDLPLVSATHAFVDLGWPGDLRTLNWYQGSVTPTL